MLLSILNLILGAKNMNLYRKTEITLIYFSLFKINLMSDSIVWEHPSINYYVNYVCHFGLVKYGNQFISVKTTYNKNYNNKTNYLVISNADTKKLLCQIELPLDCATTLTKNLNIFMYSDCVLWVGIQSRNHSQMVWLVNLSDLTWTITTSVFPVKEIIPLGNKCFTVPGLELHEVHVWSDLVQLDHPTEPVYLFENSHVYCINWSSSSIEQFTKCNYVKTFNIKSQMDFLDENFNLIISLKPEDFFPNYIPVELIKLAPDLSNEAIVNHQDNSRRWSRVFNQNILLYSEFRNPIYDRGRKNMLQKGIAHTYCWDFNTNTQIFFPSRELEYSATCCTPFRSLCATCKIKYIEFGWTSESSFAKIYEPEVE